MTSRPRWSVALDGTLIVNGVASSVSRLTSASALALAVSAASRAVVSLVISACSGAVTPAASAALEVTTASAGAKVPPMPAQAAARSVDAVSVTPVAALTLLIQVEGTSPRPADVAWNGM